MTSSISVPARLHELETLREWLEGLLRDHRVPSDVVDDVFLITEEIFANTVSYGYDDDPAGHEFEVRLRLEDDTLSVEFRDDARPFDPLARPDVDLDLPEEERPIGGLGIHLVKELSDRVGYEREGGMNVLTVERKVQTC